MIKHALELGKNGVKLDNFVRKHVRTILTEDIKRQKAVADRIATLFDRSKKPQPKNPEAAIDEFLTANGSDFKENGKEHAFGKLRAVTGRTNTSIPPLDELALPSDRRNHQLAHSIDLAIRLTDESGAEMKAEDTALNRSFHDATNSFVVEQMQGANVFAAQRDVFDEIRNLVPSYILGKSTEMLDNLFFRTSQDIDKFKAAVSEICVTFENQFARLELAARLFSNEQYLEQIVPPKHRSLVRRYGEALREIALLVLDSEGPYMSLFRMAQAAEASPEIAKSYLGKILSPTKAGELSDSMQAGESKPPSKPLPPIPTGLPLDQKLGPPPAVQPPLPTAVAGG